MNDPSHDTLVQQQFGPRASSYVDSRVHAQGEDLQQLARIARAMERPRVLDLGCGGGHAAFKAAPHASTVVACDLSAQMLNAVQAEAERLGLDNIQLRRGSVERLPFQDATFDLVCSRYSAHHWADLDAGLREAWRVLRPGGRAVFMDVVSPGIPQLDTFLQAVELLRDPSHVRDYAIAEWQAATASAGFIAGAMTPRRLQLDFSAWTARMHTPVVHADAVRSLQHAMPAAVHAHFAIQADGSFSLDTMSLEASKPPQQPAQR